MEDKREAERGSMRMWCQNARNGEPQETNSSKKPVAKRSLRDSGLARVNANVCLAILCATIKQKRILQTEEELNEDEVPPKMGELPNDGEAPNEGEPPNTVPPN